MLLHQFKNKLDRGCSMTKFIAFFCMLDCFDKGLIFAGLTLAYIIFFKEFKNKLDRGDYE